MRCCGGVHNVNPLTKKKGKKSPEPEEVPKPPEILSEVDIGSTSSMGGFATFTTLTLPADVSATSYDGEHELAFIDRSPEDQLLPFMTISADSDCPIGIKIDAAPAQDN